MWKVPQARKVRKDPRVSRVFRVFRGSQRTARAYGYVESGGAWIRSKNIALVQDHGNGIWCITLAAGIDPARLALS